MRKLPKNRISTLLIAAVSLFFCLRAAEAATYSYRQPITITNGGSSLTNHQILITVNTAALVPGTGNSHMLASGNDIRFSRTDNYEGTSWIVSCPYWIESGMGTATTKIWVKVDAIAATPTDTTLYMYYGNSSATSSSNGTNTFVFFDDFSVDFDNRDGPYNLVNSTKWIEYSNPDGSYFAISNGELQVYGQDAWNHILRTKTAISRPVIFEWSHRIPSQDFDAVIGYGKLISSYAEININNGLYFYTNSIARRLDGAMSSTFVEDSATSQSFKMELPSVGFRMYVDGTLYETDAVYAQDNSFFTIIPQEGFSRSLYMDNLRVRKYASPEPSATPQAEQTYITADTKTWVGTTTAWDTGTNWSPVGVPISTSVVVISSASAQPTISTPVTIASLNISDTAILTLGNNLTVTGNANVNNLATITYTQGTAANLTVNGTLTVYSGGTITCPYTSLTVPDTGGSGRTITAANIDIQTGGTINADMKGFPAQQGPGQGLSGDAGSYGGRGGHYYASGQTPGPTYGSITNPISLGSGGYDGTSGGAIVISTTGTVTVNGTLSAGGTGGGSGGTVNITAATLAGSGTIRANGGNSSGSNAQGGGGRIAITQTTGTTWSLTPQAFGGSTNTPGAAGTIYLKDANDAAGAGELIIDNNNVAIASGTYTDISSLVTDTSVGSITLTASKAGKLSILSGQTLTTTGTGTTLNIGAGTTLTNSGTLSLGGTTFTKSGTWTAAGTSTTTYTGQADNSAVTLLNGTHGNLTLNKTGTTFNLPAALTVSGNLTITAGVLDATASNYGLNLSGNWVNSVGASGFTARSGTVTLNGTNQTISGTSTFYGLTKSVTTAATLTFANTVTQTIASGGTLTLNGASAQLLSLRSSTPGTRWNLTVNGSTNVSYADVQDSNASAARTVSATYSVDSGNNLNWLIDTASNTKKWVGTTTAWATDANWSPSGAPTSSSKVVIDGSASTQPTISAAAVTIASLTIGGASTLTLGANLTVSGNADVNNLAILTYTQGTAANLTVNGTLTVYSGGTITCPYTDLTTVADGVTGGKGRTITAGNIDIQSGGTIKADGLGFPADQGPGKNITTENGGSYGGRGATYVGGTVGPTYGSITNPTSLGSGGEFTAAGGAIIISATGTVTVNGILSADGAKDWRGGAGSGGSVNIAAATLSGSGTIRANGGIVDGTSSYTCGGGGRISLNGVTTDNFSGTLQANGGSNGLRGYAGTIYLNSTRRTALTLGGAGNLSSLRLGTDDTATAYTFGAITIQSGGTLEIDSNLYLNSNNGGVATLNVTSLDVQSGGTLKADNLGFPNGRGPGKSTTSLDGGSYGGRGGDKDANGVIGPTYGSITNPTSLGSGGYISGGGGAIIISATGTVTVNGTLSVDGSDGWQSSCGSGGSVNIVAATLSGSGTIRAKGGSPNNYSTGGGGGRIAITQTTGTTWIPTFQAFGGSSIGGGGQSGAAGTVYLKDANDAAGAGELIIDNNNVATASGTDTDISSLVTDTAVGDVTIRNAGKLQMASGTTLTCSGAWNNTAGENLTAGTVTFDAATAKTITPGSKSFYNLTFNRAGGSWTPAAALTVTGNLTITAGTLDVTTANYGINLAGNWSNSGAFTARNGTVTLNAADGTTQKILGATTFYNLSKTVSVAATTLMFQNSQTQTFASGGTLTLGGAASNLLSLRSCDGSGTQTDGTQWKLNPQGTRAISYVDVKDSNNINAATIIPTNSVNSGNNLSWVIAGGSLGATNVEPASLVAGIMGNVTASFTTVNPIPVDGKIKITFPANFAINSGGATAVSSATGIDGTFAVSVASQVVTITRSGGTISQPGAKTIVLTNIKNPNATGVTGAYSLETTDSAGTTYDSGTATADTIVNGGALSATNVEPASLYAAAEGNVNVSFTTLNPIPADGKIEVTFPAGFTLSSGAATTATSATMDGTLAVSISLQVVTITRSGGTQQAAAAESITLTNIKNPTTAGLGGTYAIKTASASGVTTGRIDQDTAVAADTMLSVNLSSWNLNLNTGVLTLNFDTNCNAATLTPTAITLQNAATATTSYTLTGGTGNPAAGSTASIDITLSAADLNAIKANANLAKSGAASYLRITPATISDLSGNTIVAIADGAAMAVTTYTADTTAPVFSSWILDMNAHTLALNFSESVKVSTWTPAAVTLQNSASAPTKTYALTAGSTTASANGTQIVVTLSTTDFNAIIDITGGGLCTALADSYLTLTSAAITDMAAAGNAVTAVTTGANAASYTANTVTATNFKITTSAGSTMTAGTTKAITIKAYDAAGFRTPAYVGAGASAKSLTFSGANASVDDYTPTARNKDASDVNFGDATTVNFTNGSGASTLTLYKRETALIKAAATGLTTLDADGLTLTVNPEAKAKLVFTQQPSATGTINYALAQQPKVAIRDTYGNQTDDTDSVKLYDSSMNIAYADASGTLSSAHINNTVAAIAGLATFSGVKYDTITSAPNYIYLYAESGTLQPAWSNGMVFASSATTTVAAATVPEADFNLSSIKDTEGEKFAVLKFKITDGGGDSTPTLVDRIKIAIGGTGANASTDIAWAELVKGAATRLATASGASIANDYITFGTAPNGLSTGDLDTVADSSSTEYTVNIYMKNSKLTATEGQTYTFNTNETLIGTDTGLSSQMTASSNSVAVVTGTIAVTITHFEIVEASSGNAATNLAAGGTVELKIRATDVNKNIDTGYTGNHTLLFSGVSEIGIYKPKIEAVSFGYNITINFPVSPGGVSGTGVVTLTAYKGETANISVLEVGVSPAYSVFTCAATVSAGSANSLAKTSGDTQIGKTSKGLPSTLIVTAADIYGNPKSGETVLFSVSPSGSVSPASATTAANGQAAATLTLGSADGAYTMTATPTGFGAAVSFSATGYTPRGIYIVSGNNQSKIINQVLDSPFTAKLVDAAIIDGNAIPNESIEWSIQSVPAGATGQSLSSPSGTTPANGQVSTTLTLGNVTGDYIVRATYTGVTPNLTKDFTATGTSAGATKIVLTGPSSVTAGSASSAFTLTTKDQFNNVVAVTTATAFNLSTTPVSTGAFYGSLADANAGVNPITQVAIGVDASSGQFWYKHNTAATISVTAARASGQALPDGATSTLSSIVIVPASLDHFAVTAVDTSTMTAGTARTITITAYDSYNNPATNLGTVNVKFKFADGLAHTSPGGNAPTCGGSAFGTAVSLAFSGSTGQATTSLILYKSETSATAVIKAYTDSGKDTADTDDLHFTVKHASADHLKFHDDMAGTKTVGTAFNFDTTLDAVDLYANVCDGANGATAYSGSKTIGWALSGLSNAPDGSANDVFTNPVAFTAGRSTTSLSATLYRAQSTTITPSVTGLNGTNTASNSITVGAGAINKLSWSVSPATTGTTNVALSTQPVVAVADQYGNAATSASGSITLRASQTTGSYAAVTNGTLSAAALTVSLSNGLATFAGVKYSYPETIYFEASVVGYSLTALYSSPIVFSCASELSVSAVTSGLSSTISSLANATADKVAVYAFKITDAGADGYDGSLTKIVINRGGSDTHDWTNYINDAILSDGSNETLGVVAASAITFGTGATTIYTAPNNSTKTYTLYVTLKNPLPAGADNEALSFTMDAAADITIATSPSSSFGSTSAVARSATIAVDISALKVTGSATMAAGATNALTIKAIDANGNIDKDYTGNKSLTFSGPLTSPDATAPTCSNYAAGDIALGSSTAVTFSNGTASAAVDADELKLKLYKVEIATLAVTDGTYSAAGSNRFNITITVGSAAKLFWNTQPVIKTAASAPWKLFTVGVTDAYGNVASSATNSITLTPTGGSTGSGATATVTAVAGLANFTNYFVTCSSYPGTVTLNATAAGLTASGASNEVTVAKNYAITINAKDSVTGSQLTTVTLEILNSSGTTVYGPTTSNSPFSLSLAYGTYTVKLTKEKYVDSSSELTAGVPADGTDGSYDNNITWTIYVTTTEESIADYKVLSSFVYDELGEDLAIRLWLERRGKLVVNSDLNKLADATISVYDDTAGVWFDTITLSAPAATDYVTGTYVKTVNNVLTAGNAFGRVMTAGKTYYAKCKIRYGGSTGATAYEGGTTFTLPITEKLSREIIDKMGLSAGETLGSKIAAVKKSITDSETAVKAKVDDVKTETASILTATGTTSLTTKIADVKTQVVEQVQPHVKSAILNRESVVKQGSKITIRYRTDSGLTPKLSVYSPKDVLLVSSKDMAEIGTTGIYEYSVTFLSGWGKGDFTVICSESTKGTVDALVMTVKETDIEEISSSVASIMGTTSGITDLRTVTTNLNTQFSSMDKILAQISQDTANKVNEAKGAVNDLSAAVKQLEEMSKQIKNMGGTKGMNLEKLYEVSKDKKEDITYIKNKSEELKAAMELNQKMLENVSKKPIVQTWFEFK